MTVLLILNFIFIYFSCLILMARTSGTLLNRGINSEQSCFFADLIRNAPIISLFVGLRKFTSISSLLN